MVADKVNAGSSRNAGSDKQTYYKLTLSGGDGDSVREMAETLYSGGAMDGDNALAEAALSARGFLRLCDLGVPFPQNRYGEFIGYKTDHDPRRRATSVGPYTSRSMVEQLEKKVHRNGTRIYDECRVVDVIVARRCRRRAARAPHRRAARRRRVPVPAVPLHQHRLRDRRPGRDVRDARLPQRPVGCVRCGLPRGRARQEPHRVAVRPGLDAPALERVGHVHAGHPDVRLDGR